ncbi:Putative FAD-dependent pyridine nucleotide-disulphide oxidoreductase OS=Streptomyces microflavus OX=1919 GN=Smic_59910 PE=4 SV=1 [Streptomyces microflavus]
MIVGGGAAGLSGALNLARARRSVLVFDAGSPAALPRPMCRYLGGESTPSGELQAIGRGEVAGSRRGDRRGPGGLGRAAAGGGGAGHPGGDGGRLHGRRARLLVTTGIVDGLPPVPGHGARWGREVVHCPYCHRREVADRPVGVLPSARSPCIGS